MDYDRRMMESYDTALMGILQHEGEIVKFLNVIMGFLFRRTDFFALLEERNPNMGFPPGVARNLLNKVFNSYEQVAQAQRKKQQKANSKTNKTRTTKQTVAMKSGETPEVARIVEVESTGGDERIAGPDGSGEKCTDAASETTTTESSTLSPGVSDELPISKSDELPISKSNELAISKSNELSISKSDELPISKCDELPISKANELPISKTDELQGVDMRMPIHDIDQSKQSATESVQAMDTNIESLEKSDIDEKRKTANDEKKDDDDEGCQQLYTADAECYNGAVRGDYSWSQSISDLDVYVKVPEYVQKGKQVRVCIERSRINATYLSDDGEWRDVTSGQLCWEIKCQECMWTLHPGKHVHINLEKVQERWWDALLVGEPKINVRKIDASRPITDLGDEEQAKIEEMMFNENQKRLGLPQSKDLKMEEILKKAWNAEGSPFAGQPYDPSVLSSNSYTSPDSLNNTP